MRLSINWRKSARIWTKNKIVDKWLCSSCKTLIIKVLYMKKLQIYRRSLRISVKLPATILPLKSTISVKLRMLLNHIFRLIQKYQKMIIKSSHLRIPALEDQTHRVKVKLTPEYRISLLHSTKRKQLQISNSQKR